MSGKDAAFQEYPFGKDDFDRFCDQYYRHVVTQYPRIETVVAKWPKESHIPGFSDFDGRVIAADDTDRAVWATVDESFGRIHWEMVHKHPQWLRMLEHTPGIAITWEELYNEALYQPETHHWDFFLGDHAKFLALRRWLENRTWEERDEYYYLKRFFSYYSPYILGIDPPTNMGALSHRYEVHSRILHYCVPALQAALSVMRRRPVRGKIETIHAFRELRTGDSLFDDFLETIESGYRCEEVDDPQKMRRLEESCWAELQRTMAELPGYVRIIDMKDGAGFESWKKRLAEFPENPLLTIFNGVRFARIRKGRYWFYLNAPESFDAEWLIANEFTWLRSFFTKSVYRCYGRLKCGTDNADLDTILEAMQPDVVSAEGARVVRELFSLSWDGYVKGAERQLLSKVMDLFADYEFVLEDLLVDALLITNAGAAI